MATESSSAGDKLIIYEQGQRIELIVRIRQSEPPLSGETLTELALATFGAWLRAWRAIKSESWQVEGESPEQKAKVIRKLGAEPYVTIFNKDWDGLSITVHSHSNGQDAVTAAAAFFTMKEMAMEKMPTSFNSGSQNAAKPPVPAKNINNVDEWLEPDNQAAKTDKQASLQRDPEQATNLPFRFFKRIASDVIQLQEFVKDGNGKDKYQKSATEAMLSYHKNSVQYDEGALIYYPITGAIQIKEGQYGKQAIIPTSKGRVYVDMSFNGQEKPEWATLSADLHNEYERLLNDDNAQLFAPNSVLVLKMSAIKDGKQFKNYYRVYQELK